MASGVVPWASGSDGSFTCCAPARHNLPAPGTALVGRDNDVAHLCKLVLQTDGRLVTLTGVGGCGKTRLALSVGSQLVGSLKDGVCLVTLAALTDPALVPWAVASARTMSNPTDHSWTASLLACPGVSCCWCWTTASISCGPALSSRPPSSQPVRACASWRQVESRCISPMRWPGASRHLPLPIHPRVLPPTSWRTIQRSSCSSSAPSRSRRASP